MVIHPRSTPGQVPAIFTDFCEWQAGGFDIASPASL
jgi:hypothetical protein